MSRPNRLNKLHKIAPPPELFGCVGGGLLGGVTGGLDTATETVLLRVLPPAPSQVNQKSLLVESVGLASLPERGLLPAHAPPATQLVALLLVHVSIVVLPAVTAVGFALNVTVGADATFTVTVRVVSLLLALEQVSVKFVVAVIGPTD